MDIDTFLVKPQRVLMKGGLHAVPAAIPIFRATTTVHTSSADFEDAAQAMACDRKRADFYSRVGNPTTEYVENRIARMEEADDGLLFSSGMAAISSSLLSVLKSGDHLICQAPVYGHAQSFARDCLTQLGVKVDFVESPTATSVDALIGSRTKLVYLETPSNPCVELADIGAIANCASSYQIPVLVDSTFATPILQKPITLGASLVVHSGTKYMAGHSDVMCGAVVGSGDLIDRIHEWQMRLGTVIDPHGAWLLDRGIKTLSLRMEKHCSNALKVAKALEASKDVVSNVGCPMLESSQQHQLANRQMPKGTGGVISFSVRGGNTVAREFLDALKIINIGTSLGGVESLIEMPAIIPYSSNKDDLGESRSIDRPVLVRLSVGIESSQDLLKDIERGLTAARKCLGYEGE